MPSIIKEQQVGEQRNILQFTDLWKQVVVEKEESGTPEQVEEIELEQDRLLREAKEQAEQLIESAKETIAQLEVEAKQRMEKQEEECQARCAQAIEEAQLAQKQLAKQQEQEIADSIYQLLTYFVGADTIYSTNWISYFVKSVIEEEGLQDELTIRVSTKKYEMLLQEADTLEKYKRCHLLWEEDASLEDDHCMIDTPQGTIGYQVTNGIKRIQEDVMMLLRRNEE